MEAIKHIEATASKNCTPETRVIKAMLCEDQKNARGKTEAVRQGDIYITRLNKMPEGVKPYKNSEGGDNQLAPGTSQGSRHVLAENETAKLYSLPNPTALDGPIIDAPNGCRVNHPEHGDIDFQMGGIFKVTYQRAHAEELKRVKD